MSILSFFHLTIHSMHHLNCNVVQTNQCKYIAGDIEVALNVKWIRQNLTLIFRRYLCHCPNALVQVQFEKVTFIVLWPILRSFSLPKISVAKTLWMTHCCLPGTLNKTWTWNMKTKTKLVFWPWWNDHFEHLSNWCLPNYWPLETRAETGTLIPSQFYSVTLQ